MNLPYHQISKSGFSIYRSIKEIFVTACSSSFLTDYSKPKIASYRSVIKEISMENYILFVAIASATIASPGPGVVLTITNSIKDGFLGAIFGILGVASIVIISTLALL